MNLTILPNEQTFTNSKPAAEPVDVCWVWIVQYLKHASFHFAAVNSENIRTWIIVFSFCHVEKWCDTLSLFRK